MLCEKIVMLHIQDGRTLKSLAAEYGVSKASISIWVRQYREECKINNEAKTQLQLAELVDIDRSHISAIELGKVGVPFDVIFKLCQVLEVDPKELFDFR